MKYLIREWKKYYQKKVRVISKIITIIIRILFFPITFPVVCFIVRLTEKIWDIKNIFVIYLKINQGKEL